MKQERGIGLKVNENTVDTQRYAKENAELGRRCRTRLPKGCRPLPA
jgi:hypothetical protein